MAPAASSSSCCWSEEVLHSDLLHEIVRHLDLGDLLRFSAVCRSWRTFYLETKMESRAFVPWLQIPTPPLRRFYSLAEDKTYEIHLPHLQAHRIVGSSSHGFLISADTAAADLHAVNPLTGARIPLPPTSTLPPFTSTNHHPTSPNRITSYVVSLTSDLSTRTLDLTYVRNCYFRRAILDAHKDTVNTAVVSCTKLDRHTPACLAFARPGDASWTALFSSPGHSYADIAFHKGRLHGVTSLGVHAAFDLDRPSDPPSLTRIIISGLARPDSGWHLVESAADGEKLFAVARKYNWTGTVGFDVFKLNDDGMKWSEVKRLDDDVAMFMSAGGSSCMTVMRSLGLIKGNCIYFPEEFEGVGGIGVFDLGDGSIKQLELPMATHRLLNLKNPRPLPIWFRPSLF